LHYIKRVGLPALLAGLDGTGAGSVIVCICQRLSDRDIRDSVSRGAKTPGAVFREAGCAPRCGMCLPFVKMMVAESGPSPSLDASQMAAAE
jgi:bacterioferritin-associated ferredoxin